MAENGASAGTEPDLGRGEAVVTSYRGLMMFWAVVLGVLASGAITLQILGPVPTVPKPSWAPMAPLATAPKASTPKPDAAAPPGAPAPAKQATSIPAPDPALQEPAPDYPGRFLPVAQGERG